MVILGIESSCDETAASVVENGRHIMSNVVASQMAVHGPFGGVVPELASRKHVEAIISAIERALWESGLSWDDIDAIAVTRGPGLIGSLLVGISAAKALSYALGKPLIGVNHLEAHIQAAFIEDDPPDEPSVCLVVSGGHTALYYLKAIAKRPQYLGGTLDDAAGEAFDKVAKLLGLGYPGGAVIDRLSLSGNPNAFKFPRAYLDKDSYDFSFSGLKTAIVNFVKKFGNPGTDASVPYRLEDLVSSFQEAVVDVLISKTIMAAYNHKVKHIVVVGGVAANSRLRERFDEVSMENHWFLHIPPVSLCTDNAAMVAASGYSVWKREGFLMEPLALDAVSRWL